MGIRGNAIAVIFAAFIGLGTVLLAGCEGETRAVFTKPELLTHDRLAVVGLNPENEQIFMAAYVKTFISRPITFVERSRLTEIMGEQDLLQGRLDDRTRAKLKKILGKKSVSLAEEGDLETLFPDVEVGAETPFGNLYKLRTLVDEALTKDPEIVFQAGLFLICSVFTREQAGKHGSVGWKCTRTC